MPSWCFAAFYENTTFGHLPNFVLWTVCFKTICLLWFIMSNSRLSGGPLNDCWYLLIAQCQAIYRSSCRFCSLFIFLNSSLLQTTKTVPWCFLKKLFCSLKVLHLLLLVIFQPEYFQAQDALIVRVLDSWYWYYNRYYRDVYNLWHALLNHCYVVLVHLAEGCI